MTFSDADVTRALGSALSPVFLISGVSVLLGSMTVRYGRVIDRTRLVLRESRQNPGATTVANVDSELRELYRRAKLLRLTVTLASTCIFSVTLCIFLIFSTNLLGLTLPFVVPTLFSIGLIFLILALGIFSLDFALSLTALKVEIRTALGRNVVEND